MDTGSQLKSEDLTKLAIAPTHEVTLANISTYRGWIESETKFMVKDLDKVRKEIKDNNSMVVVVEQGKKLKQTLRIIEATFKEQIHRPRQEKWSESNDFRRDVIDPLKKLIKDAEQDVTNFRVVQERKRREEEEKRIAEQRRREEEQRLKEEAARKEEERHKREHEEQEQARLAKIKKEEDDRKAREEEARMRQAGAAEDEGDSERADRILEQPTPEEPAQPAPPPVPKPEPVAVQPMPVVPLPEPKTPAVPKVGGTKHKAPWKARIVSKEDYLKALAAGDPRCSWDAIKFQISWFNTKAREDKMNMDIPGVEAYQEAGTEF